MKLTGKQIKSLQTALLSAFDYEQLRQMLSTELDQNIQQIAPVTNANLTDIIYSVIRFYAAQPEGLHKLVTAACAANPQNQELAQVAAQLLADDWEPLAPQDKAAPAVDVRILAAVALLLALVAAGVIYYWTLPKPMPQSGYNVAVAAFGERTAAGDSSPTPLSRELSDWFFSAIKNGMAQLPPALQHDLRGPDAIGPILGATPEARQDAARQKAEEFNAAVLIYGEVFEQDGKQYVQPEFYVSDHDTFFYAASLIGPDQLGAPIPFTLPLDTGQQVNVNEALDARRQVLQQTILGLGHFFADDYERAAVEFRSAANIPHWQDEEGKEIIYLLIGATALRQYDLRAAPEPLEDAERAFLRAYAINPAFARALVGLGTVAVQRALQFVDQATAGSDATASSLPAETAAQLGRLLAQAQAWLEASLAAADQSPSDYIAIKANYGLGQVHSLGGQYAAPGYSLAQARKFYDAVLLNVANASLKYLERFAAQTHAALGRIAWLEQDYAATAAEFRAANAIWADLPTGQNDLTIARNWAVVGAAEEAQQKGCAAEEAYTQAVKLGEGLAAADAAVAQEVAQWQQSLDQITQQGLCGHES